MKKKVLVVDDSKFMLQVLTTIINQDPELEVVATALDPYEARDLIKVHNPDVLTLDIELPKMDGLTFLKNLMRLNPIPVVMISAFTESGADLTLQSLELGAVDFIPKPKDLKNNLDSIAEEITEKIKNAANTDMKSKAKINHNPDIEEDLKRTNALKGKLIAIGSSTGGLEAIKDLVVGLPTHCPPIVIAQHIPPVFSASFAKRLNEVCNLVVHEATNNQALETGNIYIAPGDKHLEIKKIASGFICKINEGEKVNKHRPSVDVLFDSVTREAGTDAVGVILTGMGRDGAEGLKRLKDCGAHTIAQDKASSVVWGMPGASVNLGAVTEVKPINQIAGAIIKKLNTF